jgi:hypothetical protein
MRISKEGNMPRKGTNDNATNPDWTESQDNALTDAVEAEPDSQWQTKTLRWRAVAARVIGATKTFRTPQACQVRWERLSTGQVRYRTAESKRESMLHARKFNPRLTRTALPAGVEARLAAMQSSIELLTNALNAMLIALDQNESERKQKETAIARQQLGLRPQSGQNGAYAAQEERK